MTDGRTSEAPAAPSSGSTAVASNGRRDWRIDSTWFYEEPGRVPHKHWAAVLEKTIVASAPSVRELRPILDELGVRGEALLLQG